MIIRRALEEDKENISRLHIASINQSCRNYYTKEQVDAWVNVLTPSAYDHALKEKVFLVTENSEQALLGLGMLDVKNTELSAIYIHPDQAGQGIGTYMLQKLERIAQQFNITQLTVFSTLNAQGFYRQCGYQEECPAQHDLPNGLKLECVKMTKALA